MPLIEDSIRRFVALSRPGDAEIGFLYLANAHLRAGRFNSARVILSVAAQIAIACGYPEADRIQELILEMERNAVEDTMIDQVLQLAFEVGGGLGPPP